MAPRADRGGRTSSSRTRPSRSSSSCAAPGSLIAPRSIARYSFSASCDSPSCTRLPSVAGEPKVPAQILAARRIAPRNRASNPRSDNTLRANRIGPAPNPAAYLVLGLCGLHDHVRDDFRLAAAVGLAEERRQLPHLLLVGALAGPLAEVVDRDAGPLGLDRAGLDHHDVDAERLELQPQ